jgi:uncharacterized repeat protein (TIGR03843 family)
LSPQERSPHLSQDGDRVLRLPADRVLALLAGGEIEVEGLIPWSSNATLLVTIRDADLATWAVYKPQRGERPLWDFPPGTLGMREVATYLVDGMLGWGLVPPTVLRQGPLGLGSVQFFVRAQEEQHFFTIREDPAYRAPLKRLAALDLIANNADRKGGHCLVGHEGELWAIDNALTFHAAPKLRTVIWDFAGEPLPDEVLSALQGLQAALASGSVQSRALGSLLAEEEMAALHRRLRRLIKQRRYPEPGQGRSVPWPLI